MVTLLGVHLCFLFLFDGGGGAAAAALSDSEHKAI
jgi:hypothetical protein